MVIKSFFCFALETAIFYCNKNEIMPHYFDECEIFCISVISLSCNFFWLWMKFHLGMFSWLMRFKHMWKN